MRTVEELEALVETLTRERDKFQVLAELSDGYRRERDEARAGVERLTDERDELLVRVRELEAECERLRTFAAQNFSQMIRQEAEQMREYGLSYEGVRKVLHEYNDGEISFGKLMDLIRAAARAMAEDMQK